MLRDIADIYNRNLISIVMLSLILVIPVTYFIYSAISYLSLLDTVELNNVIAILLIIANFTVLFPPFLYIALNELNDTSIKFIDLVKVFPSKFGFTAFLTLLFFLIAVFGSVLFFIPSIIACMFILILPLFSDEDSIRKALKKVWRVIKSEHIFILIDLLIIVSFNLLVWSSLLYLLSSFENNNLVYITIRVLVNAVVFPLIYFYLAIKYRRDMGEEYGN
ncbi:MAG TPA: hypothetical protein GX497_01565 [Bacillus bacterium]|nr:hypothetical protein [Bacillus sp. (in: firmicutes)]